MLYNVRAFFLTDAGKLQITGAVENVANKVYRTVGFDLSQVCGCNLEAYGRPRWATIGATYHFQ
jgi:iron complex outermembrane receptor protein